MSCPVLELTNRRRGGGKVGIPRTLRDFQARRESRRYDFSWERLFHGRSRRHFGRCQGRALRRVSSQTMRPVCQTQRSIQVLMHDHLATRQRGSPAHPLDLQAQILERSEEHTSELQSQFHLVCRLLLEKKKKEI